MGALKANLTAWVTGVATDPAGTALIRRVRREHLTYLEPAALFDLRGAVRNADRAGVRGVMVECGCALGGSAIVLGASRRDTDRALYIFDVFGMIPPPSENDGEDVHNRYSEIAEGKAKGLAGDPYYGYQDDLLREVEGTFARFGMTPDGSNVHLIKGLFEDTVFPTWPVAVAHIDGDWYESVKVCLDRLWPTVVPGGRVVIDDYFHWSGCRHAVDEFLVGRMDCKRVERARLHLIKQ